MTFSHSHAARLLTYLAAHDNRTVGDADIAAWKDAGSHGRWEWGEAHAAVRELVNTPGHAWIEPGAVTGLIRSWREDAHQRAAVDERRAARERVANDPKLAERRAAIAAGIADIATAHAVDDAPTGPGTVYAAMGWERPSLGSRQYRCPWCGAAPEFPCVATRRGGPQRRRDDHPGRIALTVGCGECGAAAGHVCTDAHPHHVRDVAAAGPAGMARRKSVAVEARQPRFDEPLSPELAAPEAPETVGSEPAT